MEISLAGEWVPRRLSKGSSNAWEDSGFPVQASCKQGYVSCREYAALSSPAALKALLYPKCTDVCAVLDLATLLSDFCNSFV